jgi:hypothetical protein
MLFADRLSASPAELLDSVKHDLAALYTGLDVRDGDTLSGP